MRPLASVAIANHNGGRLLEDAIRSALAQDLDGLEVILVDDASTDDSLTRARRIAASDSRLRIAARTVNGGPGAARNNALDLARGEWLAILDGDDLMHPSRLRGLLAAAEANGADVVADDLLLFFEDRSDAAQRFLRGPRSRAPTWLSAEDFARETRMFGPNPNLGFLKPVIRLDALRRTGVRYDETLPIGEDHDLLLRLLASGLKCRIEPSMGYFYRKHSASTSHRLGGQAVARMIDADARFRADFPDPPRDLSRALDLRLESIRTASAFIATVEALKARRPLAAVGALLQRPPAIWLFGMPLRARLARMLPRRPTKTRAGPRACIISRQRLVGRTNGSSTYLLDVARAARSAGLSVDLVQPTPVVMGRWPVLRLRPEMRLFDNFALRGVVRIGDILIAKDPAVYLAALRGVVAKAFDRLRIPSAWVGARPAGYAPGSPWTDQDRLFVARHARGADALIADYAWQTEAFPFAVTPSARTAVVMHDLFHARAALFRSEAARDSVAALTQAEEMAMLTRADAILAIQAEEAEVVERLAPQSRVILVPMTAQPRDAPQPGSDRSLLFVGSNTAPNVLGIAWFFEAIWPTILIALPNTMLLVAGSVARGLGPPPPGVRYLGVVDDLAPLYRDAGVVISPLTTGSGLKIKLVEALSEGKACVATGVTLQGVGPDVQAAVSRADAPASFAAAVIDLLCDRARREAMGAGGLAAIRDNYTPEAAHAAFRSWLTEGGSSPRGALKASPAAALGPSTQPASPSPVN